MDIVITILFAVILIVPSILAHTATRTPGIGAAQVFLRSIHFFYMLVIGAFCLFTASSVWGLSSIFVCYSLASASMFKPVRVMFSAILTFINRLITCSIFIPKKNQLAESEPPIHPHGFQEFLMLKQILLPSSVPHLNGLVLYLIILPMILLQIKPEQILSPSLSSLPTPRLLDAAFFLNFLSTLFIVACGVGIFITRKPKAVLYRLGLVRPGWKEFAFAGAMCAFTFFYDYLWSLYSHSAAHGSAFSGVMSQFNQGQYGGAGGLEGALIMASGIGLSAGIEEEVLMRGAIQPVLGIIPAAFLHAALHLQFSQAPLFMVQIFVWSALMGVLKHYTNTTTTLIAHALFNFISCFLIGFNP